MMETTDNPAKKIRFLLHTNSMTMGELAERLGITQESMREIVDELAMPTPHLLQRICGVFELNETYFGEAIKQQAHETTAEPSAPPRVETKPPPRVETKPPARVEAKPPPRVEAKEPARPRSVRRQKKLDLTELVFRHQALLDCLVAGKIVATEDYLRRVEVLRSSLEGEPVR